MRSRSGIETVGRRRQARVRLPELRALEHARRPLGEQRDRDADDDLVEQQPDAEDDHDQRHEDPAADPGQVAEPVVAAVIGAEEARVGAVSIMPSSPMLSTPAASEICSPSAVNMSGTPASRPPATSDGHERLGEQLRCERERHRPGRRMRTLAQARRT